MICLYNNGIDQVVLVLLVKIRTLSKRFCFDNLL